MLLSSSPVPWCNTGAAGTKSIYRKSQKTHEWTRRHTTDNNVLLWPYRCLIKSIISCLVFLLSSPVIDVCVLKLTGLQRCCIHLHTICQQQQQQQLTKRQSFKSITYTKLCQISGFILIFMEIWIKYEPADDHSYKSLMVWPTTYSFYSYFFKRL